MAETATSIIADRQLPKRDADFYSIFCDAEGAFIRQETELWDFKETWPASYSDDYFLGIVRLICAFRNSHGGLIIFGVNDKKRLGGFNKISPDLDRLSQAVSQIVGQTLDLQYRRYLSDTSGQVDVVLVHKKNPQCLPTKFNRPYGSARSGTIWVRRGHEVCAAEPTDMPLLYCDSHFTSDDTKPIVGQLPPSPATVKNFIGRMEVIDQIFAWIFKPDEPRAFLWGKGGSGKSTIAYEVASNIKRYGRGLLLDDQDALEQVIYISAKKTYLNIGSQKSENFTGKDFSDERSLFESILMLGSHLTFEIDSIEDGALKKLLVQFFNENSCIIIIDDIDTLTTANVDAGMEFIFRAVARAKKSSKILYTLRNRPTHALSNSIEVPGLPDDEYKSFLTACAKQFGVPGPKPEIADGRLKVVSEKRPLVIESIVSLRRSCGNYETALQMFDQAHSEDLRKYVFEREWQALSDADRGREILALMAMYKKPIKFDDLCILSKLDRQKVADSISQVQEMFLVVEEQDGESIYNLGELTRLYVLSMAPTLNYYETLKVRVEKFKSTFYPDSSEINRLKARVERAIYEIKFENSSAISSLFAEFERGGFAPSISEDPRFHSLHGYVALFQDPPAMDRCRSCFEQAFSYKFAPEEDYIRAWFETEKETDQSYNHCKRIDDLVSQSKGYSNKFRWEIRSRRASFLYNFARKIIFDFPTKAVEFLEESVRLHLGAYKYYIDSSNYDSRRSEERARNTSFYLIQQLARGDGLDQFTTLLAGLIKENGSIYLDPLVEPIQYYSKTKLDKYLQSKTELQKLQSKLDWIEKNLTKKGLWRDQDLVAHVTNTCSDYRVYVGKALERFKKVAR